jgi:hypothetical protein
MPTIPDILSLFSRTISALYEFVGGRSVGVHGTTYQGCQYLFDYKYSPPFWSGWIDPGQRQNVGEGMPDQFSNKAM